MRLILEEREYEKSYREMSKNSRKIKIDKGKYIIIGIILLLFTIVILSFIKR